MMRTLGILFLLSLPAAGQTAVSISASGNGLSSLRYGGNEFIGNGDFRVNGVLMQRGNAAPFYGDLSSTVLMDRDQMVLTRRYAWGNIVVSYFAIGNKLQMNISTHNASDATIQGIYYEPLGLQFPATVKEYNGTDPLLMDNIGAPSIVGMSYGSGTVTLVNEDVVRPLEIGFPWAWDKPADTFFPLRVSTNRDAMYPVFTPMIQRPIAPGGSDNYQISLRFGPGGASSTALAADVISRFATNYPRIVKWDDRRPVGALVMATSASGWPTNPRGWFLDPSVDVTTPEGLAIFQARVMQYADVSIGYLKSMNAQGMITWDIEGEQYPQATSYACDPRQLAALAPEMDSVADMYFKKFRDAGLKVGVCVRPQNLVFQPGMAPSQQDVADPASLLIAKIQYAKERWGATLFYVDSNGGPNNPTDPDVLRKVAAAFPDVLLVPEHNSPKYWAYTAPGLGLNDGFAATPPQVNTLYPDAFSLIYTLDGPIATRFQDLVSAVGKGDVLIFRAWFDDQPANSLLRQIQRDGMVVK